MTTITTKCRSKNPAACRYHGSLEVHVQQLKVAENNYIEELRTNLQRNSSESKLEKQRTAFIDAQASVDAHDENYQRLVQELSVLENINNQEQAVKELKERIVLAERVRAKKAESESPEDLGWKTETVRHLPQGAKMASGETVLAVRQLSSSKREVILQDEEGKKTGKIWNAGTRVSFLPLEAQQKNWAPNMVPTEVGDFAQRVRKVWDAETSTAGVTWSPYRPEKGQCAVTALLVQDNYGGTLNRALVNGESHYWNTLPDGTEVDLTRAQFDQPVIIEDPQKRERDYLFTNEATVQRYNELKARLSN